MAQLFAAQPANTLPDVPNFNVCPTTDVHVVTSNDGVRSLSAMRWGFIPQLYKAPNDGPLLINARAETIAQKPAFGSAARQRRGIMIANGFYEWTKDARDARLPHYIYRRDGAPLYFACIWQDWDQGADVLRTCACVTTSANAAMSAIHHRMPVILEPEHVALWLGEQGKGAARLMRPSPENALHWHRVDRAVNSNRAQGSQLIEPLRAQKP